MYDRKYQRDDTSLELNFEASGALMEASLVMRDRETDSWWSIMTSKALAGGMKGAELVELPVGEKTTWADWVTRHPQTRVLSVNGREHDPRDGYADYFGNDRTFRDLEISDTRLPAKEPIFAFRIDGRPHAVAHRAAEGGRLFALSQPAGQVFLYRPEGAEMFASTVGYLVPEGMSSTDRSPVEWLEQLEAGGAERLRGFDTFWYSWAAVNHETRLLR